MCIRDRYQRRVRERDCSMSAPAASNAASKLRLYYHPSSSAALRVLLFVMCKRIRPSVELVAVGARLVDKVVLWTLPKDDPHTARLGTRDFKALSPEGRVPLLLLPDQRMLSQSEAIIHFLTAIAPSPVSLLPTSPWERALVEQIVAIVACDIHPLQNLPMVQLAIRELGMAEEPPARHRFRAHFIRSGFGSLESVLKKTAGKFSVGDALTEADLFVLPQVRNGIGAGITIEDFPTLARVWNNLLEVKEVRETLDACGGVLPPKNPPREAKL
eukprot:TRINITY_DN26171_c0_g1_i1.p1 TRINITY_DN26171_c0_g1~~TRINITY_DN26171_c0_g1_i1.p1  ORF type:complete len:272 (-),score=73.88 TRINITY_DN26171_c0_g1_i1:328-1143(-)